MEFTLSRLFVVSSLVLSMFPAYASAETVQVTLRLKEKAAIETLARSVNDPTSPRYQKFYSPEEIRNLVAPSDADYARLVSQLKSKGIEVVSESRAHLSIVVRGELSAIESFESRGSLIASMNGLTSGPKRHPHLRFSDVAGAPRDGAQGMLPAQIKQLYGFNPIYSAGITGKNQHIAIATYDGFFIQDIKDYYSKNGLTPGPQVDQVVFNGAPAVNVLSAAETQTDAEFSGMIAPDAQIHIFASNENSDQGELTMFTAILDDNRAKIVNYSWGSCERELSQQHKDDMDKVYARAVAQGVNVMVASGDSGSDCEQDGSTVADFPAAQPDVVAVGGTTLSDNGGGLAAETAWNGSGGGISSSYGPASYQNALGAPYNAHRSYPDVAFNADPNSGQPTWIHYDPNNPNTPPANANYIIIGGTSIAAPQWCGFLALVGQARGTQPLGALSPIIYAMSSSDNAAGFNDVTSGSNGAYTAAAGWDAVTGWGSMKANALFSYLKSH